MVRQEFRQLPLVPPLSALLLLVHSFFSIGQFAVKYLVMSHSHSSSATELGAGECQMEVYQLFTIPPSPD